MAAPPLAPEAAVAETHSGVVFFFGELAYKVKKPVDLGFLDFRTVAARRTACHREVELNRRFAPDVYLGVADVIGPDGAAVDHLVVMRRMPASRRLSTMVVANEGDLEREIQQLAARVAAIHAESPITSVAAIAAGWPATLARWERLLDSVEAIHPDNAARVARARRLVTRYLQGRTALFDERVAAGCARDGHGDLLADDIFLLDDGPRILDCLDFDDSLREGDVLADVAFLAMDLERLGRPDLARTFLDTYRDAAESFCVGISVRQTEMPTQNAEGVRTSCADWPASLEHHHLAERALVRADVSFLRARQQDDPNGRLADLGRSLLGLCLDHLHRARVRAVVVCGPPGTGKSTVAVHLADELGAVLLRSDAIRTELPLGPDRYDADSIDLVYAELVRRAAGHLARGRSVVLDATWSTDRQRAAVRGLASCCLADLTVLECDVPADVAEARVRTRRSEGTDPSEATVDVARRRRAEWRTWREATLLRTDGLLGDTVASALRAIEAFDPEEAASHS